MLPLLGKSRALRTCPEGQAEWYYPRGHREGEPGHNPVSSTPGSTILSPFAVAATCVALV